MRRWLLLGFAVAALGAGAVFAAAWFSSPTPRALDSRVDTRLHASGGRDVSLSGVAPILREAVVATEDERFYRHHGIDVIGIMRALPYDVFHLTTAEGASTITEQVAKLIYLGGNDHSPWRKLEDMALALKLERRYSKEQILAAYLNSTYFGEGAVGIGAASERYFGVSPRKLGAAEASLLAGLVQAPSAYDPVQHPAAARERQVVVLRSLVRSGALTTEEASAAIGRPLRLRDGRVLPAVQGIDFAPGPAFIWWELTLGAVLVLLGAATIIVVRTAPIRVEHRRIALRLASLALVLVGVDVVARSFRVI
ncbi:MAG: biosynthetic peptidoglycan transglycosylase [Gaiellaceae bacterium]|jgi:membrane peptidoglycan carboxypeptidase